MKFLDDIAAKWQELWTKAQPAVKKIASFWNTFSEKVHIGWIYVVKLRKVILAIPVAVGAVILAIRNLAQLPASVGLGLQSDGTYSVLIARELAVLGPVAITALCLLLMFVSKRTLTPWMVSVFSLAVPVVVLLTNVFPA